MSAVSEPIAVAEVERRSPALSRLGELALVGGVTLVLFPLSWLLRRAVGLDDAELAVSFTAFYFAYVINDPHFAVTYFLFYKDVRRRAFGADVPLAQRVRFVVAGLVVPVALALWSAFAIATRSGQAIGWMVQLMYLLVGWHYAKQGFGVLAVLSARRGVPLAPRLRSAALFHCYAGWAFAWANPAAIAGEFEEKGVVYWALAHPRWLELVTGAVFVVSTLVLAGTLVTTWRADRRVPMGPLIVLLVTIWSWTIFSNLDPLLRYVIPGLHSIQYLYFVWLMRRNEARSEEGPPLFGRPTAVRLGATWLGSLALAWLLFHGAPDFLDAAVSSRMHIQPDEAIGPTPFLAAFFVFVNVHHYFMDHVIWRRENPDTRFLRAV